ncbi:alpha/beta fold hydrolase [Roseateles sp.]|uniref:alpha/beta fold hydrolase n=1 Tax=Roseateles sp. TaxID=1971397 RepID=UPI003BA3E7F3
MKGLAACLLAGCAVPEGVLNLSSAEPAPPRVLNATGPVVVLQAGLGDGASSWRALERGLSAKHTVLALDRPGYGARRWGDGPRDPCTVAAELRAQLQGAGLQPPYLLVGHSLGGLYQWAYSRLYPEEVAGLLLIEPTHPEHWQRLQAQVPALAGFVRLMRVSSFGMAARREFDDQAECNTRLLAARPAQMPYSRLLVRARFSNPMETGAFEQLMRQEWHDWLKLSGAATAEPVADSGHYLHQDQTAQVQRVIEAMASQAQPGRAAR